MKKAIDSGSGNDRIGIKSAVAIQDSGHEKVFWQIRRFKNREEWLKDHPYSVTGFRGNLLLKEGINELFTLIGSSSGTKFDNTNANLGVGDSNTAAQATDTGLLGTSKTYKTMDASYPTYGTSQKITFRSTFQSAEGNHDWNEFTVANGNSDSAMNLNRKVSAEGTKQSGQVWELTLEISLS